MESQHTADSDSLRTRHQQLGENLPEETEARAPVSNAEAYRLLGSPGLSEHANTPLRASVMLGAQQTHGNRAVQRAVQRSASGPVPVQRDDDDDQARFKLLPPDLHLPLGRGASLNADTSSARLNYNSPGLSLGAGYEYGGDIFATGSTHGLTGRLGFNPSDTSLSLGGSYHGFNAAASVGAGGSASLGLGYGAPLLPMPGAFGSAMTRGEAGMEGLMGAGPGFLNDPLGTYRAQSGNIDAVKGAGSMLGNLAGAGPALPFGAGLRLGYDPLAGLTFGAGIQGSF